MHFYLVSDMFHGMSTNIKTEVKKLPNSRVEITATIPEKIVTAFRAKALARLQKTIEIDGFRKGHVPEAKILERIGETGLLAEMADDALTENYTVIIKQADVQPIGRPDINITKLAPGNDVEYVITSDLLPTVELSDVTKIAKEKNKEPLVINVDDAEIEKAIKEIRQMRAHENMHKEGVDHHDHNHQNIADEQLPELNDEFVKSLGAFESVDDFMKKLKENMSKEKETHAHEKRRIEIIEAIIAKATIDIPESLVDFELNKMLEQMKYDLAMSGMKIEEYAQHVGKTIDEMKTEWRDQAVKRVHMQLVLEKIASDNNVKPDQEKIDKQVSEIMEMYKDQSVEEANVIAYVTQILTNTAVFDWLETQK